MLGSQNRTCSWLFRQADGDCDRVNVLVARNAASWHSILSHNACIVTVLQTCCRVFEPPDLLCCCRFPFNSTRPCCSEQDLSESVCFDYDSSCGLCTAEMDPYYILHYTYGNDYTLKGEFTPGKIGAWRFDKRSYSQFPPPRNLPLPPLGDLPPSHP